MASPSVPVISPVLKQVVELKINELNQAKEDFKNRYYGNKKILSAGSNVLLRVITLLEEIKKLDPYLEDDDDLQIIGRYLEQAKNDRSISQGKLMKYEKQLLDKLAIRAHRLDVSSLHVDLLKEALYTTTSSASFTAKLEKTALDDGFEVVESELETVYENFEKNTFAKKEIDLEALEQYLSSFFESNEQSRNSLERLREDIQEYGNSFFSSSDTIDEELLKWCIKDILNNGLISDERRTTLQGYLGSPAAICELTSTLNTKSICHWRWRNPEKGLPVTARQNPDGKYCITSEEGVIDMLFLHTLALSWSMKLREYLTDLVCDVTIWPRNTLPSSEDMVRREYYLFAPDLNKTQPPKPDVCTLCHGPPPPPMNMGPPPPMVCPLPPPPPGIWNMTPKKRAKNKNFRVLQPPQIFGMNLNNERDRDYKRDSFLPSLPKRNGCVPDTTPLSLTQENAMKYLVSEARVREAFDDEVDGVSANIKSFASSLPHETILTLLKFIGVPELWLDFFARFLKAPLNIGPLVRGTADQVFIRTCGVSVAHAMQLLFEELALFFVDLAVHRDTKGYMYRIRDHLHFVGTRNQSNQARHSIAKFGQVMGLEINIADSFADLPIGLLSLNIKPGVEFTIDIDHKEVEAYARLAKKQLAACTTVLDWIRVWNNSIGIYASHLFGPLTNVFGKPHLEAVTKAYNHVHEIIFEGSNLTNHIKGLLKSHIRSNLPDPPFAVEALIYLPAAYGGFGVKNPYVTLNLARNLPEDPKAEMKHFMDAEKDYYKRAVETWSLHTQETRDNKLTHVFNNNNNNNNNNNADRIAAVFGSSSPAEFMTFEQFTAHREQLPYPSLRCVASCSEIFPSPPPPSLITACNNMLIGPRDNIEGSEKVCNNVRKLSGRGGMRSWFNTSGEDKWMLQMYSDECFERYGGLEAWLRGSIPTEALGILRGEEEHDVGDDASSVSEV